MTTPQMSTSQQEPQLNGAAAFKSDVAKQEHMPPKKGPVIRPNVSLPLEKTPLWKIIYALSFGLLLITLFYTYRLAQLQAQSGGLVNVLMGRSPDAPLPSAAEVTNSAKSVAGATATPTGSSTTGSGSSFVLEDRLHELADELGIHPRELASAIQPLLPSATQTSIANANPTADSIAVLGGDDTAGQNNHDTLKAAARGFGAIMGMDDPVDFEG